MGTRKKQQTFAQHRRHIEELKEDILEDVPSVTISEIMDYIHQKQKLVITVKFTTLDREVFTQSYAGQSTIAEVKEILKEVFNMSTVEKIVISQNGTVPKDDELLSSLVYDKHFMMDLDLQSTDPKEFIAAHNAYKSFTVPDIITVTVVYDDCTCEDFVVEVENRSILKPFLGGYRDRITQIEYHHGYTQTGPFVKKDGKGKTHRTTQTYKMRNRKEDTMYSRATQMSRQDYYIPNVCDKVITAGKYESADDKATRIDVEGAVRVIQRYYRAWKLRKALKLLLAEYRKRILLEQEELDHLQKMDDERKNRELIGKVFPRTKADFFMLYTMLENWKKAQIDQIKKMACGPSKMSQMYLLLEKEIDMLMSIEQQKKILNEDRRVQRDLEFLKTISTPLSWNSDYKNLYIEMDTLETQAGREYVDLFRRVCDTSTGIEGRMQAYMDVKLSLRNHMHCEVGLEIISLIDRACLLIGRGLTDPHLEELHKRIEACIMKHYHMKECNRNIALRYHRVTEKLMKDNLFYCHRCKMFRTHDEFNIEHTTTALTVCKNCSIGDKIMEPWRDIQPYRFLLKLIRRDERRKSSHCSIAYILTDNDIYHIITQIWQSHSVISEVNDIYKLRLCRFFKDLPWAPWNCILLTAEEARAHLSIKDLKTVYDPGFLQLICNKHILAKRFFKRAIKLNDYFQEIGEAKIRWDEIFEKKEFIAVNSKTTIFLSCH